MSQAIADTEARVGDLIRQGDIYLESLTARAQLRAILRGRQAQGELGEWQTAGNPHRMGELYLREPSTGLELRFLKEQRATAGGIPVAGYNRARREYWTQPALPGFGSTMGGLTSDSTRLLLLWNVAGDTMTFRLVHPLAPGHYGESVPNDMSLGLAATPVDWTEPDFGGDDEPEDFLPPVRLDEPTSFLKAIRP
ncbi:MAG: hypothetical protein LBM66_03590 [Bifidobacteriaceae bacterium]|nr:hypothetical protein [Bifidobacteriaceae bacterium]